MQIGPFTALFVTAFGVAGFVEVAEEIAPKPVPDVEILAVELVEGEVVYTRQVNSSSVVRAAFISDMVDTETERSVDDCVSVGRSDYGPEEPELQIFRLEHFFAAGCADALMPGRSYEIVATVQPVGGLASTKRSAPFVWSGQ